MHASHLIVVAGFLQFPLINARVDPNYRMDCEFDRRAWWFRKGSIDRNSDKKTLKLMKQQKKEKAMRDRTPGKAPAFRFPTFFEEANSPWSTMDTTTVLVRQGANRNQQFWDHIVKYHEKGKGGVEALKDKDDNTILYYCVHKKGEGYKSPKPNTLCECRWKGVLIDERAFDDCYLRGETEVFAPNEVIRGWTEAMQQMVEGDLWEIFVPPELGYGYKGAGKHIPSEAVLCFMFSLEKIYKKGQGVRTNATSLSPMLKRRYMHRGNGTGFMKALKKYGIMRRKYNDTKSFEAAVAKAHEARKDHIASLGNINPDPNRGKNNIKLATARSMWTSNRLNAQQMSGGHRQRARDRRNANKIKKLNVRNARRDNEEDEVRHALGFKPLPRKKRDAYTKSIVGEAKRLLKPRTALVGRTETSTEKDQRYFFAAIFAFTSFMIVLIGVQQTNQEKPGPLMTTCA
eukprot:gnl/MRDRNA2_/MRDRNA2_50374_c0_seq1.p1 gnl/MRDRNA2_/MRDRNA2_50374_c0~~gnl/MRDRNA2_/MRDRNA2_50374_c0_seq1.p1  ORF type:complete len:458 (-),score=60.70 gnl/MRDRNA2_/MRDRNA2_50374_c0_seq1:55-1428(-)